jgi:hypothetical protein
VQEAERVQSRGHTQPDDAHFSHGVESMLPVYRGVAERTLGVCDIKVAVSPIPKRIAEI